MSLKSFHLISSIVLVCALEAEWEYMNRVKTVIKEAEHQMHIKVFHSFWRIWRKIEMWGASSTQMVQKRDDYR